MPTWGRWRPRRQRCRRESRRGATRHGRWWHRGPFVRREVRLSVGTVLVFLFVFYVALPLLASHRSQVGALAHINVAYLALGVLLEIAALVAYTQLTHSVLPHGGPTRFRLFRINLSTLALSHVSPGRHGPGRRPRLPAADPVRGDRRRHRLRPRHPGHRLGGRAQRASSGARWSAFLVTHGFRVPGVHGPRLDLGLHPGDGGRRRRGGPARRLRRPLLPAHPGPGAGQPASSTGCRPTSASSTPTASPRWSSAWPGGSPC